jgi:hypothetical protein
MADSLGDEVSYMQIVVLSKMAGSTIITYEVQPPQGLEWFSTQATVDYIVTTLQVRESVSALRPVAHARIFASVIRRLPLPV